jgi:hypothetical protein
VVLGRQASPAPALHVLGQFTHRLLRDFDAFTPIDRSLRCVDGGKDFGTASLALDPQTECLPHHVLGAFKPPTLDGTTDKILLLGSESYLHAIQRSIAGLKVKAMTSKRYQTAG